MKWDGKIPFDRYGSLWSYVAPYEKNNDNVVWKENHIITCTLKFEGFQRGRSSAIAMFSREFKKNCTYPMFLTDFADVIRDEVIDLGGEVMASWTFCKRGANFGIKLASTPEKK